MGVSKSPSYLVRQRGILYVRVVVPVQLRPRLGRSEYRFSLGTAYLSAARGPAARVAADAKVLFQSIITGESELAHLTDDDLKALVVDWFHNQIAEADEYRITARQIDPDDLDDNLYVLSEIAANLRESLALRNYRPIWNDVDELIDEHDLDDIPKGSREYKLLCRELMRAKIGFCEREEILESGGTIPRQPSGSALQANQGPQVSLSEAAAAFIQEKTESQDRGWTTPGSRGTNIPMLELFVDLVGNVPVRSLTKDHVRVYQNTLLNLPARRNTKAKYRKLPLKALLKRDIPDKDKFTDRTIKNHYRVVSSFLDWASNDYDTKPGLKSLLKINVAKPVQSGKDAFSLSDLETLFHSPYYVDDDFTDKQAHYFWVPLIGLYTGMRLEEICQLHLEDVYEKDGVWLFDINRKPGRSAKTKDSSVRIVPIPPVLINELNFLNYVSRLKASSHDRLFPILNNTNNKRKYGHGMGRWFNNEYKIKLGIKDNPDWAKKTFHSFRHTFISHCQNDLEIEPYKWQVVAGHAPTGLSDSGRHYVKQPKPGKLLGDVISKIDYGLALTTLQSSRFTKF